MLDNYGGKLVNGPNESNDVWINPLNGGMYITDPMFPRPYWDDADPRKYGWPPNDKILFITGPVDRVTAIKMNVKGAANW